jgi:hypothetical protein
MQLYTDDLPYKKLKEDFFFKLGTNRTSFNSRTSPDGIQKEMEPNPLIG